MKIAKRNDVTSRITGAFVLLFLLISTTGQTQERRTEPARATAVAKMSSTDTQIKTFQVKPSQTRVLVMPAAEHPPQRPKPMDSAAKQRALASVAGSGGGSVPSAGDIKAKPEAKLKHIILSAKKPFYNKRGYLKTFLPFNSHPNEGINFNRNYPGMAVVYLNVEQGRTYLLDFSVSSWAKGTYKIKSASGEQSFNDPGGNMEHVLVGLNAQSSGWTPIEIQREGPGYYLYSIEVTLAN